MRAGAGKLSNFRNAGLDQPERERNHLRLSTVATRESVAEEKNPREWRFTHGSRQAPRRLTRQPNGNQQLITFQLDFNTATGFVATTLPPRIYPAQAPGLTLLGYALGTRLRFPVSISGHLPSGARVIPAHCSETRCSGFCSSRLVSSKFLLLFE
jgi:hypothetical protein